MIEYCEFCDFLNKEGRSCKFIGESLEQDEENSKPRASKFCPYNVRDLVAEKERLEKEVCELNLCEATRLVLRPNQLYIFTVDEECEACKQALKEV